MSGRRLGVLAALLAVLLSLTGPASAGATYNPYDPRSIEVSIRRAALDHVVPPNYVTTDIVVTKADGTPPTANYRVFLTFNERGKVPTDNPGDCQQQLRDSSEVPRGVYRCTSIIGNPAFWEFTATVNEPTNFQHVLKVVSVTLDIRNALVLEGESWRAQQVASATTLDVFLLGFLVAALGILAISGLRRAG
ncbi:MAG TPA: hypothetical protein VGL04_11885 [Sporichthyaceae bacterium]|jgi:hypothetical protein